MLSQTVLLALAGSAAAILAPGHFAARHQLHARQTGGAGSCAAAVASVEASMPTPPPALISWAGTVTQTDTDPCGLTVPDSIKPVLTSYESQFSSWYVQNSAALNSALSQCPKFSSLAPTVVPSCTPGSGSGSGSGSSGSQTTASSNSQGTGSSGSSSSGSGSGSSSGSGSGSGSSNGNNGQPGKSAANRETALIGAAVALASFLGVVAAL